MGQLIRFYYLLIHYKENPFIYWMTPVVCYRPRSTVSNVADYRWASDCRSRGCEFDPGLVPSFRGD